MRTTSEAASRYVSALLAEREAKRRWRAQIKECDRDPKCLFEPDTFRSEWCEVCVGASLTRERAHELNAKKHSRLLTLIAAVKREAPSGNSEPDLSVVSPSNVIMPDGICPACGATGAHDCSTHRRLARALDAIEREACRCFGSNELHDAIAAARGLLP